jgi:hypothetical protein
MYKARQINVGGFAILLSMKPSLEVVDLDARVRIPILLSHAVARLSHLQDAGPTPPLPLLFMNPPY